jgi:hypothetical protein
MADLCQTQQQKQQKPKQQQQKLVLHLNTHHLPTHHFMCQCQRQHCLQQPLLLQHQLTSAAPVSHNQGGQECVLHNLSPVQHGSTLTPEQLLERYLTGTAGPLPSSLHCHLAADQSACQPALGMPSPFQEAQLQMVLQQKQPAVPNGTMSAAAVQLQTQSTSQQQLLHAPVLGVVGELRPT